MLPAAHDRVGGSQLLFLLDPDNIIGIGESANDLIGREADHDIHPLYADFAAGLEHIGQHGPTADLMQHLRSLRVHPSAAPSRQNYRYRFSHLEFTIYY
jgi:hypothetical protein